MHSAIQIGLSDERMHAYENELCNSDYKKWIFMTNQNKAYRMTDLFAPGVRESQDYYQKAYLPFGIHYEAILSPRLQQSICWCCFSLPPADNGRFHRQRNLYT